VARSAGCCLVITSVAACAPARSVSTAPAGPLSPRIPPVSEVRGDLRIDVVYPGSDAPVAARDSTFIFGNVGRGDAQLTINGASVAVAPNGGWLAFLPVPAGGVYELTATAAGQTVSERHNVRVPPAVAPPDASLRIIEGSVTPGGTITGVRGERIEVSFRGTPGAQARLHLPDGRVVPLIEQAAIDRAAGFMLDEVQRETTISEYVGSFELSNDVASADTSVAAPALISPERYLQAAGAQGSEGAFVELVRGTETVRRPFDVAIGVLDEGAPRVAVAATARSDSTVIGRRQTGADQAWEFFWPNGTLLAIDGEAQGFYRVRLADQVTAWVVQSDVRVLPPGTPPPSGFVGPSMQVSRQPEGVDVRFGTSTRLPFRVVPAETGLTIEFYGATGRPAYVGNAPGDDFVHSLDWEQHTDDVFRFSIQLTQPLWGYRYQWDEGGLVLQVRRPPTIDDANPLRGLRIGVDAGHLGSESDTGAIGPTRLTEAEATAWVAQRLVAMLRERGADAIEIRPAGAVVPLIERPILADRENVHLLVSIHFNAFPDGVNPFENHGTTMFYFWPHSLQFARHLQREVLADFGLPDRGVRFQNLGMTRTTWMPAVLTETLFMMFPDQEAALRDPTVLDRIAAAHLRAMESFVRARAGADPVSGR
jgi:N-acetylmuramoyl-L-alanine amidase